MTSVTSEQRDTLDAIRVLVGLQMVGAGPGHWKLDLAVMALTEKLKATGMRSGQIMFEVYR